MTKPPLPQILNGQRILVCRPQPDADHLCEALRATGANAEALPCIAISPCPPAPEQRQHILNLDQYALIIVTSQHAARYGLALVDEYWPQFPVQQRWVAIGRKTASILEEAGINVLHSHQDMTSETLLQLPELNAIQGKKVLVLKGMDGRKHLQQALMNRSARVDAVDLYQRSKPHYSGAALQRAFIEFQPGWCICLSAETLTNLHSYANEIGYDILNLRIIVPSKRVAQVAKSMGFTLTYVTENLMPIDIIRCLKAAKS